MSVTNDGRFLFTSKFLWDSSCITFGLPVQGEFPFGQEGILSEKQPEMIENKIDPKKGMSFPDWLVDLASSFPQIGQSTKITIATVHSALELMGLEQPVIEGNSKKGKSKDKKGRAEESDEESKGVKLALDSIRMMVEVEKDNLWIR